MESFDRLVFFAGEHLSTAHAWVEGAILSALRVLIQIQEEKFDVVFVGGGLLAIQTAMDLAQKRPEWKILLLESDTFLKSRCSNEFEWSSATNVTKDHLRFGPDQPESQFNADDLMQIYGFNHLPKNYLGQIDGKLEFQNTTKMILNLLKVLQEPHYQNITLRENEGFIDRLGDKIITTRRTLTVHGKTIFLDNCYINEHIQSSLGSYHLNVRMEEYPMISFPPRGSSSVPTWQYKNEILSYDVNDTNVERRMIIFQSNTSTALSWLRTHASNLIDLNLLKYQSNYKRTQLIDRGHIIDYLPNTTNQSIVFFGETQIDSYPVWINILVNLILNNNGNPVSNYSISLPDRLVPNTSTRMTFSLNLVFFTLLYFLLD